MDMWTDSLDHGNMVDVVYTDFQKVFDTVPHYRLLHKLEGYGITGTLHNWISAFLTGITQRVSVRGHLSNPHTVTSGIPQGSVLGPILFITYVNDVLERIKSQMFQFADDVKLCKSIDPRHRALDTSVIKSDLRSIEDWVGDWKLDIHPDKCKAMTINNSGRGDSGGVYTLTSTQDDNETTEVQCCTHKKDLGIIIDNDLTFDKHLQTVAHKYNT